MDTLLKGGTFGCGSPSVTLINLKKCNQPIEPTATSKVRLHVMQMISVSSHKLSSK